MKPIYRSSSHHHMTVITHGDSNALLIFLPEPTKLSGAGIRTMFKAENYQRVVIPDGLLNSNHAVFSKGGLVGGPGLLDRCDVWYNRRRRRPSGKHAAGDEVVVFDVQVGNRLTGHEGLVHGGVIGLLFDEAIGWGYQCQCCGNEGKTDGRGERHGTAQDQIQWEDLDGTPPAVTANLNVTYKQPLPSGQRCLLKVWHEKTEGRKLYFSATLELHGYKCGDTIGGKSIASEKDVISEAVKESPVIYAEATCLMVVVNTVPKSHL